MEEQTITIGISSCLLGEKVRFDSGHKQSSYVNKELRDYFSFVSVCPEVGMGLPVPRPTIRLMSNEERISLVETKDATKDYTDGMLSFTHKKVAELESTEMCGYIVCAKSPSCGMERVKVYTVGHAKANGVGLYTEHLMKKMPWLPVEEDGRLNDPVLKENFISRVFGLNDFYQSMQGEPTPGKIVDFHSRYKLTLMAHNPTSYKTLGRLVAHQNEYEPGEFYQAYRLGLMEGLKHRASRKNVTNVLMHIQGYFKRALDADEKRELAQVIDDYRTGLLPLHSPLTLLKHYLRAYPDDYLASQRFLQPHPEEMRLRYGL
ncbi:YbgA family protein [Vibrio methylphosphonaticus]|uniref:YbgA family protein n=1 Tax=Vibrio methylphosphonaticus TaxID=2946866 RepID=UPI00202A1266|nr:2-thiouracil desulfurase family protein [Vibrio methylphosphonaticus]MCL9775743.1 2-thiouracil desulfurase family protein [Vibrio methylphosphonaticus]